jgi:hypothetical protein
MKIRINTINFENIECTNVNDTEPNFIYGATSIFFEYFNGSLTMDGTYIIKENIGNKTIRQLEEMVEEYLKKRVLKA